MYAYGTGQMATTLIETIAGTVHELATPDMKPKALIAAVREKHPEAKKSDIVRAAFFAVIAHSDDDPEKARRLQAMAIAERTDDGDEKKLKASRKPRKTKDRHVENGKAA